MHENYRHGGHYDEKINFDFTTNINPLGMPEEVKRALKLTEFDALRYPDLRSRELIEAIQSIEPTHLETTRIIPGNGASELITALAQVIRPNRVLLQAPGFYGYERAFRSVGSEIHFAEARERNDFCLTSELLDQLDATNPDVLVLCHPSNPVGMPIDQALLPKIADECRNRGCRLLIDECFLPFLSDFSERTAASLLSEHTELTILRAFTKLFAVPGVRLGYALFGDEALAEGVRETLPEWNVSTIAQTVGIAACEVLRETDYLARTQETIEAEHTYLTEALTAREMKVYPSAANFLLFRSQAPIHEALHGVGIAIRVCDNFQGLPFGQDGYYYRIAIRPHAENEKLIEALRHAEN